MISNESDARFYVAKSTIKGAGKGLFAKIAIAKGDKLEVLGVRVPAKSLADRCTTYADAYKFRIGKYLLIPTGLGGRLGSQRFYWQVTHCLGYLLLLCPR